MFSAAHAAPGTKVSNAQVAELEKSALFPERGQ